jgi:2-keto-3-deoxy-L-rhamnonate aldolase RhmA
MTTLEMAIQSQKRPLFGSAVQSYNPIYVELLGHLGYDIVWIEMEHCPITFAQAADMCRIATGVGLLTFLRVPDSRRENVLKAAECGPDIIDLPMGNSPAVLRELVEHARYAPEGCRGFFGSSRAVGYGLETDYVAIHKRINEELCLMAQIETTEAVEAADELCAVRGVNGVFIGPGDLSTCMGMPGQLEHPAVIAAIDRAVKSAKSAGKIVAMAGGQGRIADWTAKGVQVFFIGGEVTFMRQAGKATLQGALDEIRVPSGT